MRRFAALLLAIFLLVSLSACGTEKQSIAPTATVEAEEFSAEIPMDEWERTAWYGFLPEDAGDPDSAVTWAQFCAMLGRAISLYDESRLPAWEEETADAPEEEMRRDSGMVALLFGAKAMGVASFNALAGDCFGAYAGRVWEVVTMDYPLFDWDTPIDLGEGCADNNHVGPAYDFSQRRVSLVSGLPLLEFDEAGDLRLEQPFTIEEAALAVLRLYESEESCATPAIEARDEAFFSTPEVQAILTQADERREAILTSETQIVWDETLVPGETYTGTAYYVSNKGDDGNDGLSPETAWATLDRVNKAALEHGDAVFLERGGVWRNTTVETKEGVTYSAYGQGAKPRICASPENGGDPALWSLWWEGENGEKIWLYHRDMPDCGAMVLNEEIVAQKVLGYWSGTEFLHYIGPANWTPEGFDLEEQLSQAPFDVTTELTENLTFFSQADSTLPDTLPIYLTGQGDGRIPVGELYFRCDEGNPGELYESIEFQAQCPLFDNIADGCVLDNLFIGFAGDGVVTVGEGDGVTIQNCEVGWVGGIIGAYNTGDAITGYGAGIQRLAGALGGGNHGTRYQNNYVHHMYHAGGGIEIFEEQGFESGSVYGVQFVGNLFYQCASGLTFFNWDEEANPERKFVDCLYEDNWVLFTGLEDWMDQSFSPAFTHEGGPNLQEGCAIRNNVFFVARSTIVYIQTYVAEYFPDFEGNTYVQYTDIPLIHSDSANLDMDIYDPQTALEVLGDESGTVVLLDEDIWGNRLG